MNTEKIKVITDLQVHLDRETVLKLMDCYPESAIYEEVVEEYEEICEEMKNLCRPQAVFAFGKITEEIATEEYPEGTEVVYLISTIGGSLSSRSTQSFQEGDCLRGMMLDSIADCALFSLEEQILPHVKEMCAEKKRGIKKRLEAPQDIPMQAQQTAFEQTAAAEHLGLGITSGYMLDPVKSSCQIFVLTEDEETFKMQHDCRKCPRLDCKLRTIPASEVTVLERGKSYKIEVEPGVNLLEALVAHDKYFSAVCGGRGSCGKCKIRVVEGKLPVTPEDRKCLTEEELEAGWRLSCKAFPKFDLTIEVERNDESDFEIVSEYGQSEKSASSKCEDSEYGIAVDIGTTTIAFLLIGRGSGETMQSHTRINRQRAYGADVISRIQASEKGKKEVLKESICQDLTEGIRELLKEAQVPAGKVTQTVISANTTMVHLLMGYDCSGLGVYPFTSVNIELIQSDCKTILGNELLDCEFVILPGISTYVGGDIVSGMYALEVAESEKMTLLVDLGTNGEMGLGNSEEILVTSTAAGPAFEGGNISCGMGSVAGAISNVRITDGKTEIETIGDKAPVGLCGTGVVETMAELLKEELVDETGLLDEDYFDDGFELARTKDGAPLCFTQQDVREIQLAKAAVRAGIETLLCKKGISYEQVDRVCIAGGFGFKLDHEKAIAIGMIPEELKDRISAVGNSSLQGAVHFLKEADAADKMAEIRRISTEINLSADKNFNDFYMEHMMFE